MVSVNEFGYPVPPKDFAQTFGRYGANIGRTIGGLVPTASGVALGAIPASIAALGAGYAMHRGNQMANDLAVANRMQNMRDLMARGYTPTDEEGVWLDPEGNTVDLSSREELPIVPEVNTYDSFTPLASVLPSVTEATPTTVLPQTNSKVATLANAASDAVASVDTATPTKTVTKTASPRTSTKTSSSGSKTNSQSKIDLSNLGPGSNQVRTGSLDWLNDLLPLLAAGGLGYLLAK